MTVRVTKDTTKLQKLRNDLDPRAWAVVRKAAFDTEAGAKDRAPFKTSALKNSGYVDEDPGHLRARIGFSMGYAIYQEFGTRFMKAHPFLIPAFEAVRKGFLAAWKELTK